MTASAAAEAGHLNVNCDQGKTIGKALKKVKPGQTIYVSGTCHENIFLDRVKHHNVTLDGGGSAVIDGGGATAVTIDGVQGITLNGFTVQNGLNGIEALSNASFAVLDSTVSGNGQTGIDIVGSSSAALMNVTVAGNGFNGVSLDRASEMVVTGNFNCSGSGVFGVLLNNTASITFAAATATVTGNVLGIQVGVNSTMFIADAGTTVTTSQNFSTGLTVVSGSTLFLFRGTLVSQLNFGNHGVSANTNSNIDLDNGGTITTQFNALDGIQLENSTLNLFNMQSEAPSKVIANGNGRHGVSGFVNSAIDTSTTSFISAQGNADAGVFGDNGTSVRLSNSSVIGNVGDDVALTFGARGDITTSTIGNINCDATSLLRGDTGVLCP